MTRHSLVRASLIVFAVVGALALIPRFAGDVLRGADDAASVREIHLVAKDMTFYVEGQDGPNPTLHARSGERIRIVLRNADIGMSHNFAIRSWSVNTRILKGKGQDSIEFTVPATRGTHLYSCTPHAEMMSGTIVVN
jgi:Cupredoxin-like domain